jgi:DNA end-binding protein Ku
VEKKNWCSYVPIDKDRLLLEVLSYALSYADEVRALEEITVGEVALSDMEVQLAEQIIARLSTDQWHPERYYDTYRERVLALIEQKRRGRPIRAPKAVQQPSVIDLLEALRRSLQQPAPKAAGRSSARTVKKAG